MTCNYFLRKSAMILKALVMVIAILLIAVNLYKLIAKKVFHIIQPTVCGYSTAVVLTGSMAGDRSDSIQPDDYIVTHRKASYRIGDVILFESGSSTVTHRIIEVTDNGYRTQGDANNVPDGEIRREAVIGKVIWIGHGIGRWIRLLKSPLGITVIIATLVAAVEIPKLFRKRTN